MKTKPISGTARLKMSVAAERSAMNSGSPARRKPLLVIAQLPPVSPGLHRCETVNERTLA